MIRSGSVRASCVTIPTIPTRTKTWALTALPDTLPDLYVQTTRLAGEIERVAFLVDNCSHDLSMRRNAGRV